MLRVGISSAFGHFAPSLKNPPPLPYTTTLIFYNYWQNCKYTRTFWKQAPESCPLDPKPTARFLIPKAFSGSAPCSLWLVMEAVTLPTVQPEIKYIVHWWIEPNSILQVQRLKPVYISFYIRRTHLSHIYCILKGKQSTIEWLTRFSSAVRFGVRTGAWGTSGSLPRLVGSGSRGNPLQSSFKLVIAPASRAERESESSCGTIRT